MVTYGRSQAKRRITAKRRQTANMLQSLLANHGLIVDQSRSLTRISPFGRVRSAGGCKRSKFMVKEIRFRLNADEAPSLPGAYAMAIELTDKAAVMLSGRLPIALPAGC